MRFPTMWYVRPAKPQISLRSGVVWSEPLLIACIFYEYKVTDWTSFGISKLSRRLHRPVGVYACQNATLLEITCRGSYSSNRTYLYKHPLAHSTRRGSVQLYLFVSTSAYSGLMEVTVLMFRKSLRKYRMTAKSVYCTSARLHYSPYIEHISYARRWQRQ